MSDTVVYKLVTGQEVIGRRVARPSTLSILNEQVGDAPSDGNVYLEDVRALEYAFAGPGQLQMGLAPFAVSALSGVVAIKESAIIATPDPDHIPKAILDAYIKEVSGIEIAGAGSLPGANQ
jgi:hypothetical protein